MAGYRPPYTIDEEKKIINYIIKHNEYHRIKGDRVWKDMAESGEFSRTWHSLKQHFRKKLINKLHYPILKIDENVQKKIRESFNGITARNNYEDYEPVRTNIDNGTKNVQKKNGREHKSCVDDAFRLSSSSSSSSSSDED